jgi:hypothetical protein
MRMPGRGCLPHLQDRPEPRRDRDGAPIKRLRLAGRQEQSPPRPVRTCDHCADSSSPMRAPLSIAASTSARRCGLQPFSNRSSSPSSIAITITIEETSPGEYRMSQADITSVFKLDATERPSAVGYTAIWKRLDERTWESTTQLHGRRASTMELRALADLHWSSCSSRNRQTSPPVLSRVRVDLHDSAPAGSLLSLGRNSGSTP